MEDGRIKRKFETFLKREEHKKTIAIILCVIGGLVIIGAAAYIVYRLFFAGEDEYDLYDELDFYYDDEDEPEEAGDEAGSEEESTAEAGCCE